MHTHRTRHVLIMSCGGQWEDGLRLFPSNEVTTPFAVSDKEQLTSGKTIGKEQEKATGHNTSCRLVCSHLPSLRGQNKGQKKIIACEGLFSHTKVNGYSTNSRR